MYKAKDAQKIYKKCIKVVKIILNIPVMVMISNVELSII